MGSTTRQTDGTASLDTYHVYDEFGNLCYVLPPAIEGNLSQNSIDLYAYQYRYDHRNRCVWKKLPACEPVMYAYDYADRLVFSQDGNQRGKKECTFHLYDGLGREVMNGIMKAETLPDVSNMNIVAELNGSGGILNTGYTVQGIDITPKLLMGVNYYDNHDFLQLPIFQENASGLTYRTEKGYDERYSHGTCPQISDKGMLTGRCVYTTEGGKLLVALYHDNKGRVVQKHTTNHIGGTDSDFFKYTFTGKTLGHLHQHRDKEGKTLSEVTNYDYDHAERPVNVKHRLNGGKETCLYINGYDELSRLRNRTWENAGKNTVSYGYNIQGWLTSIKSPLFNQNLHYTDGTGTPRYNGNISSMTWEAGNDGTLRGYRFEYDGLDRMKKAQYGEGSLIDGNTGWFNEEVTEYDKMGNIKGLKRCGTIGGSAYGVIDDLVYTYDGNQLQKVEDKATSDGFNDRADTETEYEYDENGNMTKDLNKNIADIQYNYLNLPKSLTFGNGDCITYTYDADGNKLRTVHKVGTETLTTDYAGNVVYENGTAERLLTEAGYLTLEDGKYHYFIQDHQGNNRVVVDETGDVEETNHYYPFGGLFASSNSVQPYKYNGKELDNRNGLGWHDYGARFYDATLGRWNAVDPMGEKYYNVSPYIYCMNNPTNAIDPNGKDGIYITFPDYKISTPLGKISNLGHAGILLIDNKTGNTKYYEYGRYDSEGKGIVRNIPVPDVEIDKNGIPTIQSLNKTLKVISTKAGHGGRIEGAYVKSSKFIDMKRYAEAKMNENSNPEREEYGLFTNNCGTFAADVLMQDLDIKDIAPKILDPRPISIVQEYQDVFIPISYDVNNKTILDE